MRLGIAHHLAWAAAVTASTHHNVVDRRRIELIEPGMATAPIHYEGKPLDDDATAVLVAQVRASVARATSAALNELATALPEPVVSMSLRAWSLDFPGRSAVQRHAPCPPAIKFVGADSWTSRGNSDVPIRHLRVAFVSCRSARCSVWPRPGARRRGGR